MTSQKNEKFTKANYKLFLRLFFDISIWEFVHMSGFLLLNNNGLCQFLALLIDFELSQNFRP